MPVLTDAMVRGVKAPAAGRLDIRDDRVSGLVLRVTASGARSWALRYKVDGRDARLTLGVYPAMSLADARRKAEQERARIANGANPAQEKRQRREGRDTRTFEHLAQRYLDEHARRYKRSAAADERNLKLHVLPKWRTRDFTDLRRGDVKELCEGLFKAGKPTLANRVKALVSKVFAFAVDADLIAANPATGMRMVAPETPRDRVMSDAEIRLFWTKTLGAPLSPATGLALRVALATGQRASEVTGMQVAELMDLDDPGRAMWVLPSSRTKPGREHFVPLSPLAVDIIREALALAGDSAHVFPSPTANGAMTSHALSVAMSRLSKSLDPKIDPAASTWQAKPPRPHDLRRTAATRMRALGISDFDVSRVLNHARTDVLGRHYDKYDGLTEKRRALDAWGRELQSLVSGKHSPAQVVTLLARRTGGGQG